MNADIDAELTADLVGDYLFTDKDFINKLTGNRTLFQKVWDEVKYLCKVATGKELTEIEKVEREFARAWKEQGQIAQSEENGDVKYSISKTSKIPYGEQLSQIEKGQMNGSNSLYVGKPSEQLRSVGFSDAPFAMNQSDYRKSRRTSANNKHYSSHAVPYEFFEEMPKYLSDAPLFIDNGEKVSIVTSYGMNDTRGNASYVIAGVWNNQPMESDTVNQVKSVYPLDDFAEQIKKAAEAGKLVITNKNKAEQMLSTIGIQPSEVSRFVSLAKDSISQLPEDVNTQFSLSKDNNGNQNPTDNPDIRYSVSNSPLDNGTDLGYNVNGDLSRGDGYARTDEFRRLQAESQRMSDEDTKLYHSGSKQIDDEVRRRLSRAFGMELRAANSKRIYSIRTLLNPKTNNNVNIYEGVDSSLFHDCFEISQKFLRNGELVDLHEVKTTEDGIGYDDCENYLSEDGLSGFSITPDGDLISVFNLSAEKGFLKTIAPIVKEKAKTLDCYASPMQNLMAMYEKIFGFKTASVMDYNMEYDHDDIAENHNMPQVAFMVNTENNVETKHFAKDEYDEAVAYRDSFVNQTNDNDIAPTENFSLSYKGEQFTPTGNYSTPLNETALEQDVAPVAEGVAENATTSDDNVAPAEQTLDEKIAENIRAIEGELADNRDLRKEAETNYNEQIAKLQEQYNAKKNKNTKVAYNLLQSISRLERLKASTDAKFAKRISDLEARAEKMKDPTYSRALYKKAKMGEHAKWALRYRSCFPFLSALCCLVPLSLKSLLKFW